MQEVVVELSHYNPKKWDKGAEKCENGAKMQVFLSKTPVFELDYPPVNPCVVIRKFFSCSLA